MTAPLPSTSAPAADDSLPKLGPWEATFWMGCTLPGLIRIHRQGGGRISPPNWAGAGIDLTFAAANSVLGSVQQIALRRRLNHVLLPRDPVFILGHWRTGTTWLHELLALDPQHRAPTTFECLNPNHWLLTEGLVKSWSGFVLPKHRPPDAMPVGWDLPQEDEFALMNLGLPSIYGGIAYPQRPFPWPESLELDTLPAPLLGRWITAWTNFIRGLLLRRPGRPVLKTPQHSFRLPVIHRVFPNAKFIYLVRDPQSVIPSSIRLWKSLSAVHGYGPPMRETLTDEVLALFRRMHERVEATRELIPPQRFLTVRFEDFVADPLAGLRDIYDRLQLGDFSRTQAAVEQVVAARADYQPNKHRRNDELRERSADACRAYAAQHGY